MLLETDEDKTVTRNCSKSHRHFEKCIFKLKASFLGVNIMANDFTDN